MLDAITSLGSVSKISSNIAFFFNTWFMEFLFKKFISEEGKKIKY